MTDQLAEDKKLLGTVFYEVLTGSDNVPWVCRMKLTYISPKGRSFHFEALDTAKPYKVKRNTIRFMWPQKTVTAAIRKYEYLYLEKA